MKLDTEVKHAVRKITGRFLRLGKATPVHEVKFDLGPKRHELDTLLREGVIRNYGQGYVPGLLAVLEFEHQNHQKLCLRSTAMVLNALKHLYTENGERDFGAEEVFNVIKRMIDTAVEVEQVRLGMFFAIEFPSYIASPALDSEATILSVKVKEGILDFDSIEAAWAREIESRRERKRGLEGNPEPPETGLVAPLIVASPGRESARLNVRLSEHSNQALLDCNLLHPVVADVVMSRLQSGHYSDAVEAALKELNERVKGIVKERTGKELDGAKLMQHAFSAGKPIIQLDDVNTESGRNTQIGYQQIFSGVMTGIRNPLAHSHTKVEPKEAVQLLVLVSLLFNALDRAPLRSAKDRENG